ncbi:N-acetylglucosamine kinase [Oceanobacillus massiliensis]|uniref:N-acetylglucosamine kinase n=1 Tax=Oceanobacillus massiliensis TaxID=1465765 RepID=UPI00028989E6|nr:BadF/BadG/BcrA/BcrD ATPase family protein [Oceanobacillus massiliensis]
MEFVLGIDGGGTKTQAAIMNRQGEIAARCQAGATNLNSSTVEQLKVVFKDLFSALESQLPGSLAQISYTFAGIAGAGNEKNKQCIEDIIKSFLPSEAVICVESDTMNALYSGTYGKPGIVHISGTGSITYGINSRQQQNRVGGWGYLLGDEGSGYDIGRQGVIAALKAYDGRGPATILLEMLYGQFAVDDPQDLIKKIYAAPAPKNEISALSRIVMKAYLQGDSQAQAIVDAAVREIVWSIQTLYIKLFAANEQAAIVLCGGVFGERAVLEKLQDKLRNHAELTIVLPKMPPVGGSLIGAFQLSGENLEEEQINNIIRTIQ